MSLNVIIVAVIALVILVVLIMIFAGKTKFFSKTTSDCASRGGECKQGTVCPEGYVTHAGGNCDSGYKCCAAFDVKESTTK